MTRIARERIMDLFGLAEREVAGGHPELADRYVVLARSVGARYNVRLLSEYRELYCRGCSAYWVEGRTVRTRLRSLHRVRTCLRCGRARRTPTRDIVPDRRAPGEESSGAAPRADVALAEPPSVGEDADEETEDE